MQNDQDKDTFLRFEDPSSPGQGFVRAFFPHIVRNSEARAAAQRIGRQLDENPEQFGLIKGPRLSLTRALLKAGEQGGGIDFIKEGLKELNEAVEIGSQRQLVQQAMAGVPMENKPGLQALSKLAEMFPKQAIPQLGSQLAPYTLGKTRFSGTDQPIASVPDLTALQQNLVAAGLEPGTPEFRANMMKALFTPKTKIDVNTGLPYKVPTGYMLKDPNNPMAGLAPIPGGPVERLSPEQAAKKTLLENAKVTLPMFKGLLYDDQGDVNRGFLFNMNVPMGGTPGTEGRSGNAMFKDIAEGKIRAESGAAVPDSEVARMAERFRPSMFDSDVTIKLKLRMLENFLDGTLFNIDPESELGRYIGKDDLTKLKVFTNPANQSGAPVNAPPPPPGWVAK